MMLTCKIIKSIVEDISKEKDISLKVKTAYIVDCRFAYFGLCQKYKRFMNYPSLMVIANHVQRNHATAIYGTNQFKYLYKTNGFAGTFIYNEAVKRITEYIEIIESNNRQPSKNIDNLIKEIDIKAYYKIKNARLQSKYRSVINTLSYKLQVLRQKETIKN